MNLHTLIFFVQYFWFTSKEGKIENTISLTQILLGVNKTKDGGFIVTGYFTGSNNQLENTILENKGSNDGLIIKYNSNTELEWVTSAGGSKIEEFSSGFQTLDGGYIVKGYTKSDNITLQNGDVITYHPSITTTSTEDGLILKFQEVTTAAAIPQKQELTFTDTKKSYNITTAVNGSGGSISGQGQSPYETVLYKGTSTKDITATPSAGYAVSNVTVNGTEIAFTRKADGSVTLNKFTNMSEN